MYIKKYLELLFINPQQFVLKNEVSIYENKVVMISLTPEENIGTLIESSIYVDTFKTIFNLSWLGATSFIAK